MTEVSERPLPQPDLGEEDYRTFGNRLLNQNIREKTTAILDREGVAVDAKEFEVETKVPPQLLPLLRLKAERDSYFRFVVDILTIKKDCQTKLLITHASEQETEEKKHPERIDYKLVSEVNGRTVGSYSLILEEEVEPRIDFKAKRGLGHKSISVQKWRKKNSLADSRDFQIISDALDIIMSNDPTGKLHEKEYHEHIRQVKSKKLITYMDEYSQEAEEIREEAKTRLLKEHPRARIENLK